MAMTDTQVRQLKAKLEPRHVKIRKANRDAANFAVEIAFSAPGFSIILDN